MGAVGQGELGAVNGGQAVGAACLGVLDDAGDAVVIGQGESLHPELDGGRGQLIGLIGSVKKGVGGVGVQLGVAVSAGHHCPWHLVLRKGGVGLVGGAGLRVWVALG